MGFAAYQRELLDHVTVGGRLTRNLVALPRIDSTNALARRIASEYFGDHSEPPPVVIAAWEQTAGRGRRGRPWLSPAGSGVYVSLLLPVAGDAGLTSLPLLVAVGLCRAVDRHLPPDGPRCRLKWPNDLLLDGRKLGGVLIETVSGEAGQAVVIGFGVNLEASPALGELASPGAATLQGAGGGRPRLAELTWELVGAVETELTHLGDAAYAVRVYQQRSSHRPGERLACHTGEGTVEGVFLGFDRRGFLRLKSDAGGDEVVLAAGEVLR